MLSNKGFALGLDFPSYIKLAHHSSGTALKDYIFQKFPQITDDWASLRGEKLKIYTQMIEEGNVKLMPKVEEFLSFVLEGSFHTCVVTNSPKKDIDIICNHLPLLNQIPKWFTRETYARPKPHPDGYLSALNYFSDIPREKVVGFEDSLKGIEALKAAKIFPILVCDKKLLETSFNDLLHLESLSLEKPL